MGKLIISCRIINVVKAVTTKDLQELGLIEAAGFED
jgi:hypothetical protein